MDPWDSYQRAVGEAYRLALVEAGRKMRGHRVRTFDERGVHPFSMAWGRAAALRELPEVQAAIAKDPEADMFQHPRQVSDQARAEAVAQLVHDAKEGGLDAVLADDLHSLRREGRGVQVQEPTGDGGPEAE